MGHIALIVFKLCSFKFYVSHLLNKIHPPVCRQLNVETIEAIFKASNSEYRDHVISTDDIINQAIDSNLQQTPFNLEHTITMLHRRIKFFTAYLGNRWLLLFIMC